MWKPASGQENRPRRTHTPLVIGPNPETVEINQKKMAPGAPFLVAGVGLELATSGL